MLQRFLDIFTPFRVAILCVAAFIVIMVCTKPKQTATPHAESCEQYSRLFVKDIPASCLSYFIQRDAGP